MGTLEATSGYGPMSAAKSLGRRSNEGSLLKDFAVKVHG